MTHMILKAWKNSSISSKLYFVVGLMALLIVVELLTLKFATRQLSAVRAFVGGEALWSKGQKNAVFYLQRYAFTNDPKDFESFQRSLKVPLGDHVARVEMQKPDPDMDRIRSGFLQGEIHPDDIVPMVRLIQRFHWVSYIDSAIKVWTKADVKLFELITEGERIHAILSKDRADAGQLQVILNRISALNDELTVIENDFSLTLGAGSRWLEKIVFMLLIVLVLTVESIGLTLTILTSREISRGLSDLVEVAEHIGQGQFGRELVVGSMDEIGKLKVAVNKMGSLLQKSYVGLEEKIASRTSELNDALKAREEFLSIASHELKTPLTSLLLQLQLLERSLSSEEKPSDVAKLRSQLQNAILHSKKLNAMQATLFDITRLNFGTLELKHERTDLLEVVRQVVAEFSLPTVGGGVSIQIEADTTILGELDSLRVGQVVTNLISNAIKYGNGLPVRVTLTSQNDIAFLSVTDQGPGIPEHQFDKIFHRFERLTADRFLGGLGLGLYISKQIVDAHGGKITVSSVLGQGTTFLVELPLQRSRV